MLLLTTRPPVTRKRRRNSHLLCIRDRDARGDAGVVISVTTEGIVSSRNPSRVDRTDTAESPLVGPANPASGER